MNTKIRMTLTGPMEGKTIKLNGYQFVGGHCEFIGSPTEITGITTYFERCYQVEVSIPKVQEAPKVKEPEAKEPNERQMKIIEACNGIDKEEWVDKHATAHPKIKDIAELMEDPTVTKDEVVEVVRTWLS